MTFEELVRAYIRLFILVLETVGQDIGNKTYQNVSKILEGKEGDIKRLIDEEVPFSVLVAVLEAAIITEIHDVKNLAKEGGLLQGLVEDMWSRYLKEPSNKFFKKNGIQQIDKIGNTTYLLIR